MYSYYLYVRSTIPIRIKARSVRLWTTHSLETVTKSNEGCGCLVSGVLLCQCYQIEGGCN